jgi:hypothetical protein
MAIEPTAVRATKAQNKQREHRNRTGKSYLPALEMPAESSGSAYIPFAET